MTNWHTPYTCLMSELPLKLHCIGEWNYRQRDKPANVINISLTRAFFLLFQNSIVVSHRPAADFLLIIVSRILRNRVILVLHGQKSRSSNGIRLLTKEIFYRLLPRLMFIRARDIVGIQQEVIKSFGYFDATVINPWCLSPPPCKPELKVPTRCVVVANDLSRNHFDKDYLLKLHNSILPVSVIGRNSDRVKDLYPFKFIETASYADYLDELDKGGFAVNCLLKPEAPYNLGLLECLSAGMPLISVFRDDLVFLSDSAFIMSGEDLQTLKYETSDVLLIEAKLKQLKKVVDSSFSRSRFIKSWTSLLKNND